MSKFKSLFVGLMMTFIVLGSSFVVAQDSTSIIPLASMFSQGISTVMKSEAPSGVPVGTIIAWPVSSQPEDPHKWLECNGQTINPTVYPDLAAHSTSSARA